MDFNQFDSRKAAEAAARLHLNHPATGEPLFADDKREKPCVVLVIGTESRSAQAALRAIEKAKMAERKADKQEGDQSLEDLHASLVAGAKPLIKGFENVMRGDRAITTSPDDIDWLLNLQLINGQQGEKSFVEQIMGFATKRGNFLGNGSKA